MANSTDRDDALWFEERIAALEPSETFQVDGRRGRARFDALRAARGNDPSTAARSDTRYSLPCRGTRRVRRLWLVAVATSAVAVLVSPWPRAAAQRLWDEFFVSRVTFVEINRDDVPDEVNGAFQLSEINAGSMRSVPNPEAAELEAGFRPTLPVGAPLSGPPKLLVVLSTVLSTGPVDTMVFQRALDRRGLSDLRVPSEWRDVRLAFQIGPLVFAEYPEATVIQTPPVKMITPAGFRYDQFIELGFRLFGRSAEEAHAFGRAYAANPTLVMLTPPGARVDMRDVTLLAGQGVVIADHEEPQELSVFWMLRDRVYAVTGNISEDVAVAIANAIP